MGILWLLNLSVPGAQKHTFGCPSLRGPPSGLLFLLVSLLTAREAATVQYGKDASSEILGFQEVFEK